MPYSSQRDADGADRYRTRKIDNRLATIEDDIDAGVIGGGGGGGAPTGAAYVTIGANATLTAERALTAGAGITITDAGANSTVTVAASGDAADLTSGTLLAARMPALTGDVTMTAGTTTTTIAANAVVNADLAQVATKTIKGRLTAATGNVEDLTFTQVSQNLDTFTSTTKGIVAGSGGGTTNYLRADGAWATPPGTGPTLAKSILTGTQANSTTTPAVLTGCTFTLTPGQTLTLDAILIFTAAATTTAAGFGVRVAQAATANGNAVGSSRAYVNISSAATATGLADGDVFNVAANTNALVETAGTATVAGNNSAIVKAVVQNNATNVNTTVTVEFRSTVAASAVTAQIGSGAVALIG